VLKARCQEREAATRESGLFCAHMGVVDSKTELISRYFKPMARANFCEEACASMFLNERERTKRDQGGIDVCL